MLLEILKINVKARARPVTDARVNILINSIADVGLMNPITVVREMVIQSGQSVEGYTLVAGAHRLEAMRHRGETEIEANVVVLDERQCRLAECDENLCGTNLGASERATLTAIRKECYEFMHPETAHGAIGGGHDKQSRRLCDSASSSDLKRFTADTAETTGRAERTIQLDAERGEKILPAVMLKINGTAVDTGAFLDEVKDLPGSKQMPFVKARLCRKEPSDKKLPGPTAKNRPDFSRLKRLSLALNKAVKDAAPDVRGLFHAWQSDHLK